MPKLRHNLLIQFQAYLFFLIFVLYLTACQVTGPEGLDFEFDVDDIGLEAGMRLGGPDLNGDEQLDSIDIDLLKLALKDGTGFDPSFDLNRDGQFNEKDLSWLKNVIGKGYPALVSVDFMFDDELTAQPIVVELEGYGFSNKMQIVINDKAYHADKIELRETGPSTAWLNYESLSQAPAHNSIISVITDTGPSQALQLDVLIDVIGDQNESTEVNDIIKQQAPEEHALGAPADTDCCIKSIVFRGVRPGVRVFAFDDGGKAAKKNGPKLKQTKSTKLKGDARTVSIIVVEKGVQVASFTFNCETLKKGIFSEPMPDSEPGASVVRPRQLFEIVDFETGACQTPAAVLPKGLRGAVVPRDNADWPKPDPHKGSGALTKLSVPISSFSDLGCRSACWAQSVSTVVDRWNRGKNKWQTLSKSKPHNDNLNAEPKPGGKPWYCYGAETTMDGPDGKELILGDGPHLVHSRKYWLGGKKIELVKGDVIRRRSVFVSQLICYDPEPEKALVSLLWSITTLYTHDPANLDKGGKTTKSDPVVVNVADIPGKKDRTALKKHLKKKKRDRKKCEK